eukprot:CAMPEP_0177301124 /NCGR_PEP_ID=MMETSP0368-20130122/4900_1 /TAXON_ID=447022 ORGANISM="Scrippsiella hangoei-like, Strain SHHI-4" /NCGR_SAMPLE_ID=MMETSP0368 /ASSEMBLY_ACC=CAM_ASM_000363 /LENGTH=275 /DNA_ID=CAMNT_0018759519 /DNA_START=64 /DNA_END=889 /DNA_ORIENTATION=-
MALAVDTAFAAMALTPGRPRTSVAPAALPLAARPQQARRLLAATATTAAAAAASSGGAARAEGSNGARGTFAALLGYAAAVKQLRRRRSLGGARRMCRGRPAAAAVTAAGEGAEDVRPQRSKKSVLWGAGFALLGLAFAASFLLTLRVHPLVPWRPQDAGWSFAWLLQTIWDYYATALCLCGVIVATDGWPRVCCGRRASLRWAPPLLRLHHDEVLVVRDGCSAVLQQHQKEQAVSDPCSLLCIVWALVYSHMEVGQQAGSHMQLSLLHVEAKFN